MADETDARIVETLVDDPRDSVRNLARKCRLGRQKFYTRRKKLEDSSVIWGYTAVVNPLKMGGRLYVILGKFKEISKESAKRLEALHSTTKWDDFGVEFLSVYYMMGGYDWMITYVAKDLESAKKSHDFIKMNYADIFIEEPKILEVIFPLVHEGKINPSKGELEKLATTSCLQKMTIIEGTKPIGQFQFAKTDRSRLR